MEIAGTGFRSGVLVLFDGVQAAPRFDSRDTALRTMYLETPPHPAGPIDIVVRNPDGQTARHSGGFIYVPPETFDPNGMWAGEANDGSHRGVVLVVLNGRFLRATCYGSAITELAPPEPIAIAGGQFAVVQDGREIISGRSVAPREMIGTMNFADCGGMFWKATPRPQ